MLIITNGDAACARMREAQLDAELLPWRDVLHDGPVPADLPLDALSRCRAGFLAGWGWGDRRDLERRFAARDAVLTGCGRHDEVVLWFEHDLYDQLQLLQVLDWFASADRGATRLSLRCPDDYVTSVPVMSLQSELDRREPVAPAQLELAEAAWAAFRAPTPEAWPVLATPGPAPLPYVPLAFARLLEELPDARAGLARSERQVLEAVAAGAHDAGVLFEACARREETRYLGDASFLQYLARLSRGPRPLLAAAGPQRLDLTAHLTLTHAGQAALDGELDWVGTAGIDRWLGGVHLRPAVVWRWDGARLNHAEARRSG
jgi:hypothetical protein